jgi:hypothetical protein
MKKPASFPDLLQSASKSVKKIAQRNGRPIAISEDGQVKIISPDKKVQRVRKSSRKKQKV